MEQNMRFGLILGLSAILNKKIWVDYEQHLRVVFSSVHVQKKKRYIFLKNILYTVDICKYENLESLGKCFVPFVHTHLPRDSKFSYLQISTV